MKKQENLTVLPISIVLNAPHPDMGDAVRHRYEDDFRCLDDVLKCDPEPAPAPVPESFASDHIPEDAAGTPLEVLRVAQTLYAREVESLTTPSQRQYGVHAMADTAVFALDFVTSWAKRGDHEALKALDRVATTAAAMIRDTARIQPDLAKTHYRHELQMPGVISRDRSVNADTEALMRAVELGEAHVIRVAPKPKRPPAPPKTDAKANGKRKGKRGPNHDSMVLQLMRPVFAHVMMLRSPDTRLAEPVPPAVAALIALPPLAPQSIKQWVDALYAWMEYLDKGHALEHPLLRQLGEPFVPDEIARPARANGFVKIKRRHRSASPELKFIKKGVTKRMEEWLCTHIRATENPTV